MHRLRGITYAGLVVAAMFLLSPAPASALRCYRPSTVYNTGTLVGTGFTCQAADQSLRANLQLTASSNCQTIYGDNADADWVGSYTETVNGCEPNGSGYKETGSASYQCIVCPPL